MFTFAKAIPQKYCYGNFADYDVDDDGTIDVTSRTPLNYLKMFAYVLFGLSVGGGIPKLYWALTETRRANLLGYMIDGIEEAMAELLAALKKFGMDRLEKIKQTGGQKEQGRRSRITILRERARRSTRKESIESVKVNGTSFGNFESFTDLNASFGDYDTMEKSELIHKMLRFVNIL